MVIPLHDDNPSSTRPFVTIGILIACVGVYLCQHLLLSDEAGRRLVQAFAAVPAVLTGQQAMPAESPVYPWATVMASMFLHGGFWHLAGNMLFLWIFGNNVEDAMGHARFFAFYLLCGVIGVFAQVLSNPGSTIPIVGASGAISGVLGAYTLLFPRARVLLGLPLGFILLQLGRFPAIWVLAGWFIVQLALAVFTSKPEPGGGIAFGAHIGGFIAGLALVALFKHRHVPLWRRH